MPKLKSLSGKRVIRIMERFGFVFPAGVGMNQVKPLLELPNLKEVNLEGMSFKDKPGTANMNDELKNRGIKVTIS